MKTRQPFALLAGGLYETYAIKTKMQLDNSRIQSYHTIVRYGLIWHVIAKVMK